MKPRTFEELSRENQRERWIDAAIRVTGIGLLVLALTLATLLVTYEMRERRNSLSARAVANLSEAVRQDPNNATARILLGDALAADGRESDAVEQYQAALTLRPDDPGALAGLAHLSMVQKDFSTAETYWLKIIEVLSANQMAAQDQRLEKAYFYLGSTYMEMKEYEDAARALREALRMKRDASDSHFLLAIAYREMGSEVKFREELEIALQYDPLLADANYEYGLLLLSEGDDAGAAEHFRVSADNAPAGIREPFDELAKFGDASERLQNARQLNEAGEYEQALTEARIAAALDPLESEAVRLAAQLFEKIGEPGSAEGAWEKLLDLEISDPEALEALERLQKDGR